MDFLLLLTKEKADRKGHFAGTLAECPRVSTWPSRSSQKFYVGFSYVSFLLPQDCLTRSVQAKGTKCRKLRDELEPCLGLELLDGSPLLGLFLIAMGHTPRSGFRNRSPEHRGNLNGGSANRGLARKAPNGPKRAVSGCEVRRNWSQSAPKKPDRPWKSPLEEPKGHPPKGHQEMKNSNVQVKFQ